MLESIKSLFSGERSANKIREIVDKKLQSVAVQQRNALLNNAFTLSPYRGLYNSQSGQRITEDTCISWSAIWRGLQLLGMAIGSLPFSVIRKDGNGNIEKLRSHPLWNLINLEPHPFYSKFDYLQAILYQAVLRGNAVVVIGRNPVDNRPESLRVIRWSDVTSIKETPDARLIYKITGYDDYVSHENIIHVKGLTDNGVLGLDTMRYNRDTFGIGLSTNKSTAAYHKNGVHSDGFLATEQELDPSVRQEIEQAFNDMVKKGEVPFLTGGVAFQKMGISPKEVQLLEARQFNVYEAARVLGVTPHLLYALDRANFSNVETLSAEFVKFSLNFWVLKIEQEHDRKLFRPEEKGTICTDLDMRGYLRGDTKTRAAYIKDLLDRGVIDYDEARQIEGWNELPNGLGKTRIVPGGYQTLEGLRKSEGAIKPEKSERHTTNSRKEKTEKVKPKLNGVKQKIDA